MALMILEGPAYLFPALLVFNHNLIIFIHIYHFTFILWDSEGAKVMALMILEGPAYLFPALLVFIVDFNLFRLDGGLTAKRSQLGSIDGQGKVIPSDVHWCKMLPF